MAHPFLPKRKAGKADRFPDPPKEGLWDTRPNTHLEMLAEAIEIPPAHHRVYSIPDPWARAILFDRALYDDQHVLHSTILGEWRGLLALLALRERRGFQGFSASEISLANQVPGSFSAVLGQLHPSDANLISGDTNWNTFYVLRWQKQPFANNRARAFAFTSPSTLVCTGADYSHLLSASEIPWFIEGSNKSAGHQAGLLVDPTPHLSLKERRAMAEWLLVISTHLTDVRTNASRRTWIIRMLGSFAKELDPTVAGADPTVLGESSLGLLNGVYRVLDKPRKSDSTSFSDVQIVTTKQNAPRYLLIEPSIAQQWNETAREITIFRDVTLASSSRLTSSGKSSEALSNGFSWCTPDFFFANQLIYEAHPEPAFPGCLPVKFTGGDRARNVVLPLNPEVLNLFTPHEIADRLTVEWLPDGGACCQLQMVLRSGTGKEKLCRIQKIYAPNAMTSVENLPLIAVWPDFRLDGGSWRTYYTFQLWDEAKEELSIKPWVDQEREPAAFRKHSMDKMRFQIFRNSSYPEALICETPFFDPTRQREAVARGLLLLQLPPAIQPPVASSVALGIDFGSTGSNVYMRTEGGLPTRMVFEQRLRAITEVDVGLFNGKSRDYFIPPRQWSAENILSVFHDLGDPPEGDTSRLVLRDGHILYVESPTDFQSIDRKRVMSNLKWGAERERIVARDFLLQLCMQAGAELAVHGASTVDVRFSYPTAFSNRDLTNFRAHWNSVVKKATELTGVQFLLNEEKIDTREAVTATRFFSESAGSGERMDVSGGALTIDVGGGTTDIAVWNKFSLLAHSSVLLAGRDILLAPVRRKPQILSEIFPDIRTEIDRRDAAFNAQLDSIIKRYGESMIEQLSIRSARSTVQGLLSILEVGLCGLCFYSGLLVRRLVEANTFKYGRRISVFIGGNGSKMFRWCALGSPLEGTEIHDHAARAFLVAANLRDVKAMIQLSSQPKSEVAYGLVCEPLPNRESPQDYARMLAGESFMIGSEIKHWNDTPSASDVTAMQVSADRNFPMFTAFLNSIERRFDEDLWDRLGTHVDQRFAEQAQEISKVARKDPKVKPDELIRNEPVFIMALKRYLELEIDEWERGF